MTRKKAVSALLPLVAAGIAFGIWRKRRNGHQDQLNQRLDLPKFDREKENYQ